MEILAAEAASWLSWVGTLWSSWVWPILLFVIGLGLVVFVHELGHFLVAKAVGIKVERFALGFGKRLIGFRKGETDYCLCLLPLGGYVKMLGQEDFAPARDSQGKPDPRSYMAKSVGARMMVISAGVVMNLIFGALLFVVVCLAGIRFVAPVVGDVQPGFPAAKAEIQWESPPPPEGVEEPGLQPGDRILEIDGDEVTRFNKIRTSSVLASPDETFRFTILREVHGVPYVGTAEIGVKALTTRQAGRILAFGIQSARNTIFAEYRDAIIDTPFRAGDELAGIGAAGEEPVDVGHYWDLQRYAKRLLRGEAPLPARVTVRFRREGTVKTAEVGTHLSLRPEGAFLKDGTRLDADAVEPTEEDEKYRVTLPGGEEKTLSEDELVLARDLLLDVLGLAPRLEVYAVLRDSPAQEAGIEPGDVIVDFAERGAPSFGQLRERTRKFADSGTTIRLLRDGKVLPARSIKPENGPQAHPGVISQPEPGPVVAAYVRPGSPADQAGIVSGDEVTAVNDREVATWIDLFNEVRRAWREERGVTLTLDGGRQKELGPVPESFDLSAYELHLLPAHTPFEPLLAPEVKKNPLAAIAWGADQTWEFLVITYASLRGLVAGTVSTEQVRGPVGIGALAVQVGREGVVRFIHFMAIISVILAVMNFLPIPVVDGGHAVFLIIEKIRGKPVPVKVQNIVQFIGIVLLLTVFVLVTWQDISRLFSGLL